MFHRTHIPLKKVEISERNVFVRNVFSVYIELGYVSSIGKLYCTADLVDWRNIYIVSGV